MLIFLSNFEHRPKLKFRESSNISLSSPTPYHPAPLFYSNMMVSVSMQNDTSKHYLCQFNSKGACQKKNTGFFGSFSKMSGPPPPPPLFGRPPSKKKFEGLFCVLGPKELFWFFKSVHFLSVFWHIHLGIGDPPPLKEKLPNNPVFAVFIQNKTMRP